MNLAVILNRADEVPGAVFSSLPTFAASSSIHSPALAA
jgi:hypothetical protein